VCVYLFARPPFFGRDSLQRRAAHGTTRPQHRAAHGTARPQRRDSPSAARTAQRRARFPARFPPAGRQAATRSAASSDGHGQRAAPRTQPAQPAQHTSRHSQHATQGTRPAQPARRAQAPNAARRAGGAGHAHIAPAPRCNPIRGCSYRAARHHAAPRRAAPHHAGFAPQEATPAGLPLSRNDARTRRTTCRTQGRARRYCARCAPRVRLP
jgi:hypothetical protein